MNWYRKAQDSQDFEEKPEDNNPSVFIHRTERSGDSCFITLGTTRQPTTYYWFQISPPSKWLDNSRLDWDFWLRKREKFNPNSLWSFIREIKVGDPIVVDRDGKFIRNVN